MTFQAIIIWRDELNEGQVLLRDIIDLEASYIGPDTKNKKIAKSKIKTQAPHPKGDSTKPEAIKTRVLELPKPKYFYLKLNCFTNKT